MPWLGLVAIDRHAAAVEAPCLHDCIADHYISSLLVMLPIAFSTAFGASYVIGRALQARGFTRATPFLLVAAACAAVLAVPPALFVANPVRFGFRDVPAWYGLWLTLNETSALAASWVWWRVTVRTGTIPPRRWA